MGEFVRQIAGAFNPVVKGFMLRQFETPGEGVLRKLALYRLGSVRGFSRTIEKDSPLGQPTAHHQSFPWIIAPQIFVAFLECLHQKGAL